MLKLPWDTPLVGILEPPRLIVRHPALRAYYNGHLRVRGVWHGQVIGGTTFTTSSSSARLKRTAAPPVKVAAAYGFEMACVKSDSN